MKNIILIFCLYLLAGCNSDFLTILPESEISVESIFKEDSDFKYALTASYTELRNAYSDMHVYGDIRSDDSWHALGNNASLISIDKFSERSSESLFSNTWTAYFKLITNSNKILEEIERVDEFAIDNKNQYLGEAQFLRALAYFDLVRIFGDVPKLTSTISLLESYDKGRSPVSEIYNDIIIPDLKSAIDFLPSTYSESDIGRPTKGAALSLLGKVFLYINDFSNAEFYLSQVVNDFNYSLLDNYFDLFDYTKDEHHSEYIFDVEYISGGYGLGSRFTNDFLPKSEGGHADSYFGIKGGLGEQNTPTFDLFYAFDPVDPRRNITVDTCYEDDDGFCHKFFQIATFTKKYITPVGSIHDSPANWKIIRYADVVLMLAESLNENGKEENAIDYLNLIRERVSMPLFSYGLNKNEIRSLIYDERRFELGMEGHRWFDLVRTGRALEIMKPQGIKPHNLVFPIPLREIQVVNDESIFPQNPGYD